MKTKEKDLDRKVQHMIDTWDVVKCKYCGKKISMLDARPVDGMFFVCKKGH